MLQESIPSNSELYRYPSHNELAVTDGLIELLKTLELQDYVVQKPIRIISYNRSIPQEDAYFPILVNNQLTHLIRYRQELNRYESEAEDVVKRISQYEESTSEETPLIILEINGQTIGKNLANTINFSSNETLQEEIDKLVTQVVIPELNSPTSFNVFAQEHVLISSDDLFTNKSSSIEEQLTPSILGEEGANTRSFSNQTPEWFLCL